MSIIEEGRGSSEVIGRNPEMMQVRNLPGYVALVRYTYDLLPDEEIYTKVLQNRNVFGFDHQPIISDRHLHGDFAVTRGQGIEGYNLLGSDEVRNTRNQRRNQLEMILYNLEKAEAFMDSVDSTLAGLGFRGQIALKLKYQLDSSLPSLSSKEIGSRIKEGMGRRGARTSFKRGISRLREKSVAKDIFDFLDRRTPQAI
ncbi:MAG: hypothetical protein WCV81_03265 [Microgenomates group bacterium]|jgi:hypothetical protein